MFDGRDFDAAEKWVDDWQGGIERRAAQAQALSAQLAQLSATARSDDGLVEVTVGPSGTVTGVRLDEGTRRHSAARTAREILAAIRAAQAALTARASAVVAETVGVESATGKAVISAFAARQDPDRDRG
jgi:DNA-binding protein YbaB